MGHGARMYRYSLVGAVVAAVVGAAAEVLRYLSHHDDDDLRQTLSHGQSVLPASYQWTSQSPIHHDRRAGSLVHFQAARTLELSPS